MDNKDYKTGLWEKICSGNEMNAFESLFHLLNKKLIQFCVLYVQQIEIAEEIVADVFVKCWEARTSLSDVKNIESYLFIAVKNHSLNYIKKYSAIRWRQLEDCNKYELAELFDPEKQIELKELSFKIEQAIESLPLQSRVVFRLIKEDGMKYKEVAEILNISPRTVQTQLYRAVKKLSALFSAYQQKAVPKSNHLITIAALIGAIKIFFYSL
ncbi:MAG TPA: RNA polymerase sigma-70 factor [Arachidicoccus sp.]